MGRRVDDARPGAESAGRPLNIKATPYPVTAADYLKAAAGPPAWSARLARIEELRAGLEEQLSADLHALRLRFANAEDLAEAWRRQVMALDLSALNQLIEKHNAYYAIEAGLRMQWPSGRYLVPAGVEFPIALVTAERLLARFAP
jgi:hypothetical protein